MKIGVSLLDSFEFYWHSKQSARRIKISIVPSCKGIASTEFGLIEVIIREGTPLKSQRMLGAAAHHLTEGSCFVFGWCRKRGVPSEGAKVHNQLLPTLLIYVSLSSQFRTFIALMLMRCGMAVLEHYDGQFRDFFLSNLKFVRYSFHRINMSSKWKSLSHKPLLSCPYDRFAD